MGGLILTQHRFTPYIEMPLTLNGKLKSMEDLFWFIQDFRIAGFLTNQQGMKCCCDFSDAVKAKEKEIGKMSEHAICMLKECLSLFASLPFECQAVELCNSMLHLLQHPEYIHFDMYPDLFKIADQAIDYALLLKSCCS